MAQYFKIPTDMDGHTNSGIKAALKYIGKRYCNKTNENDCLKAGKKFIGKKFGHFTNNAMQRMIYAQKKKNGDYEWSFHKRIYIDAYRSILKCLSKAPKSDYNYISTLIERLLAESRKIDPEIESICSNAFLFWQKKLLKMVKRTGTSSRKKEATRILTGIEDCDNNIALKVVRK